MNSFYITAIGTIALAALQPLLLTESEAAAPSPAATTQTGQNVQPAQGAPAVLAPASAASGPNKRIPRAMTAVEASQNAATPGDLRPENPVVPQISLPIGRNRDSGAAVTIAPSIANSGGIDDELARCQALATREARSDCRSSAPRPAVKPAATSAAPNRPMQGAGR